MQLLDTKFSLTPIALSFVLASLVACGGPDPKMVAANPNDGVPANSASEERLKGDPKKPAAAPAEDPTQPYTTPMSGDNGAAAGTGAAAGKGGAGKGGGKAGVGNPKDPTTGTATSAATAGGTGKVSKAECKQLFNKYIDVAMANDSRFEGIPPEMINSLKEQALSQAQSQKGDPCSQGKEVTRAQYNCAMGSSSTAGWERCMK